MVVDSNKSNKGLIFLVIILILSVVGLGGFIVYEKVLNKDTKEKSNVGQENEKNNGEQQKEKDNDEDEKENPNVKVNITFEANGGTVTPVNSILEKDGIYGNLPIPVRDGYTFDGWYSADSGGTKVAFSMSLISNSDHTLYARWIEQNKITSLSIEDEVVKKLYKDIYKSTCVEEELSFYPYRTTKVTYGSLSKLYVVRVVMASVENNTDGIALAKEKTGGPNNWAYVDISVPVFNRILKEKFGNVTDFTTNDLKNALGQNKDVLTGIIKYNNFNASFNCMDDVVGVNTNVTGVVNNKITCMVMQGGGCGVLNYTKLVKAEKDNNNIYIYDSFVAVRNNKYYKSATETVDVSGINLSNEGAFPRNYNLETIMNNYINRLYTYKHTFTKDNNGNYYYVSSEIAK